MQPKHLNEFASAQLQGQELLGFWCKPREMCLPLTGQTANQGNSHQAISRKANLISRASYYLAAIASRNEQMRLGVREINRPNSILMLVKLNHTLQDVSMFLSHEKDILVVVLTGEENEKKGKRTRGRASSGVELTYHLTSSYIMNSYYAFIITKGELVVHVLIPTQATKFRFSGDFRNRSVIHCCPVCHL